MCYGLFCVTMVALSKHISLLTAALCFIVNLTPSIVGATDESLSAAVDTLPTYVVVATRTPLMLDRVSPSTSFVSREEMNFWQDRSLVESLSRIPGVAYWSNGTAGSLSSLSVRGSESNHTSFYLDGRRLNSGFGNQYDLSLIHI